METAKVFRKIVNLAIAAGWLWVFSALGWITFITTMPLWQTLILTALISWLVEMILDWIYVTFILVSCFIGSITLPIFAVTEGWFILRGTSSLTHWFTINYPFFWFGLLMSVALGMARISSQTSKDTSSGSNK